MALPHPRLAFLLAFFFVSGLFARIGGVNGKGGRRETYAHVYMRSCLFLLLYILEY